MSDTSGDTEPELLESADVARAAPGVIRESVVERSSEPPPPATEGRRCPHCGSLLRRGTSNELCSVCLLFGMRRGKRVGDYFLDDELPGGGMGEIHLATHVDTNVSVAIKFPRPEVLATPDGAASFRNEIKAASRLKHPNIARVFHSAWQPERPYFVMEFLEGGTLEDPVNIARHRSTRGAAELVSTIADAVQHAHSHQVLHCDLKPANILFDLDGNPHVSDFGLARVIEDAGIVRGPRLPGGTPGWQSPEQAAGETGSARSDVYQLGVMLHWLVTGSLATPIDDTSPAASSWAPTLESDIETISRKALARDANHRYRTAAELADDLGRALENLPLLGEVNRPVRRLIRWAHRKKLLAAFLVSGACLIASLPFVLDSMLADAMSWIREQSLFAAKAQALAVRYQLQVDAADLEKMASDVEVQKLASWNDLFLAPAALGRHQGRFDNVFVFSKDGHFQARFPLQPRFGGPGNYAFRDYHLCATAVGERLLRGDPLRIDLVPVCVSRVFRSTTDRHLKFSLAAPLIREGRLVGVVTGSIQARDRFGGLEMRCGPGQCMTALIGPRDRDDVRARLPDELVVFAHPSLKPPLVNPTDFRDERRLAPNARAHVCRHLRCAPDLENPLGPAESGPIVVDDFIEPVTGQRSVVALAPVGRTGLIVMVAMPDAALEEVKSTLQWRASVFIWAPLLAGMSLFGCVLTGPQLWRAWAQRYRQRRRSHV